MPERVTTEDALDALPDLTVVLDVDADAWQKRDGDWYCSDPSVADAAAIVRGGKLTVTSRIIGAEHLTDIDLAGEPITDPTPTSEAHDDGRTLRRQHPRGHPSDHH